MCKPTNQCLDFRVRGAMDQIANQNVAPLSAPAENRFFEQEMAAGMRVKAETPPSDVKDPGKPASVPEEELLINSKTKIQVNKIVEIVGAKSTVLNNHVSEATSVKNGQESNSPGQVVNSGQISGLGTSGIAQKTEFFTSDDEEEGEIENNRAINVEKAAAPAQFEENYGLPATIVADMKEYLSSLKPMKFAKNDNAATRLIQKFRKSLVCPKCGSLHGHTSQGTASNQYGGTAPFKCRSSVPQLLMMLPHEVICAVGKVHREFCIKDAQLFASWMSSSKAEQKEMILKRLKHEMDIDKIEEPVFDEENIAASQDIDMTQEELKLENLKLEEGKKNVDCATEVTN